MPEHPLVIGLGELLWDCFEDSRRPGGAPANVAFQANQLGNLGVVCSRVGQDDLGREIAEFLEAQGLQSRHLQFDPEHPTGTVTVKLSSHGQPSYTIHEHVAWDSLEFTSDWQSLMQSAAAVCFGTLAQRTSAARETIHRCLRETGPDCLRVFDVNLRQEFYTREIVDASMTLCNVVKLNEDEVKVVRDLLEIQPDEPATIARELISRYGLGLVCVTRGENGCQLISADRDVQIPGEPVNVIDAVGAGDAFTAGLITALLQGWTLDAAGEFANRIGGLVASRAGAMPSLAAEFAELQAEIAARLT